MKLRYLALAATIAVFASCSSARKAQTTDDVYYSDGTEEDGGAGDAYVARDGSDDRVAPYTTYGTAESYNDYAYGYTPFDTYINPYWGGGFGMSPWYYSTFSIGFGWGALYNPFYNPYFYPSPAYYGGYYYPYYPGFGYYTKGYASTALYTGAAARINVLAYNTRHFNNVNTTVPTVNRINGVSGVNAFRPVANTVSGRVPTNLGANSRTTNRWSTYNSNNDRISVSGRTVAPGTVSRQPMNGRTTNTRNFYQNNNTRTYQPVYRPAPSNATFRQSTGGGFGGSSGGGGRVGGGGGVSRGGRG